MKSVKLLYLFFLYSSVRCLRFVPKSAQDKKFQVFTSQGLVQGKEEQTDNGVPFLRFSGIPYAKPPIGNLRFQSPQPLPRWTGVLDATKEGACCAGLTQDGLAKMTFEIGGSEDCLFLNVYTPKKPTNESLHLLPVYFFIYGGGYVMGCSLYDNFGPNNFIDHGVILVTFNYRLGVFGFLSTEDMECPGNWGIKDQLAALKWVNKNIKNFGGDPSRITIGGQSAGAASANLLLLSPKTTGLINGVILESGAILCPWSYQKNTRDLAFDVGVAMGIETNSSKELVSKLREIESDKLARGQIPATIVYFFLFVINGLPFTPVLEPYHEGAVLTHSAYSTMTQRKFPHVPVLAGVTDLESLFFKPVIDLLKPYLLTLLEASPGTMARNVNSMRDRYAMGTAIRRYFTSSNSFTDISEKELFQFTTDELFFKPIQKTVELLAKENPAYFYLFTYEGEVGRQGVLNISGLPKKTMKGAIHAEELFYLFYGIYSKIMSEMDKALSKKLLTLWTNFIKTGNPTPKQDPLLDNIKWPTISEKSFPYVVIDKKLQVVQKNFNEKNYRFWENLYERFGTGPFNSYKRK